MSKAFITKIGAFTPLSVPGSIFWLDAVDVNGTGTNPALGNITTWKDKISGITLTATSANTLVASSANGLPGVRWTYNGGNGYGFTGTINSSYAITSGPIMVCCVVNYNNQASFANWFLAVNTAQVYLRQYQNNYWLSGVSGTTFASGTQLITAIYNGASSAFFVNGTQLFTGNPSTTQWTGIISVGSYWDGTTNNSMWSGDINEMVTVSSTVNQQKLEGYLAQKWGLVSSLPAGHPGRSQTFYTAGKNPGIAAVPSNIITDVPYGNYFPLSITGCALWLDAADTSSASLTLSGSNVTTWRDKSGTGNNATANTGTVTTNSTQINGLNTIRFAANSFLNIASFAMTANISVFAVLRGVTAQGTGPKGYFFLGNGAQPSFFIYTLPPSSGSLAGPFSGWVASTGETNWYMPSSDYFLNNPGFIYTDNSTSYVNGSQLTFNPNRASVPNAVSAGTYSIQVGGRGLGDSLDFDFAECIFYNRTITTNERQSVEGYLAWKWGRQSSLPITHPYYSVPPLEFDRPTQVAGIPLQLRIIPDPWTPLRPLSSGVFPWHWFKGDAGLTTTAWTNFGTSKSNASNVGTITLGNYTQGGSQAGGTNNTCTVSPSGYWRWPGVYQTSYHAIFGVFKVSTSLTNGQTWTWKGNSTAGRGYTPQYRITNTSGVFTDDILSQGAFLPLNGVTIDPSTRFYTHSMVWGSSPAVSLLQVGTKIASPNGWTTDYGLGIYDNEYIGFAVAPAQPAGVTMTVCEILLFAANYGYGGPVDLTAQDISDVQSYLARKWGV